MFPSRVFLRLLGRSNKKSELAHAINVPSTYRFQLLSCTFSHRVTPYQRSSIQLEIGVLPPSSSSLPDVSATSISSKSTKKSSDDNNSKMDMKVKEILSSFTQMGEESNQGFLLEQCKDGGVALVGIPFSLLSTSTFLNTPSALKKNKSSNAKQGGTNSTSAGPAGQGDGVAGSPSAHAMLSPLPFLFSSETGKVNVPESVRVMGLNQHIQAPLEVYESCLQDLLHDADQLVKERRTPSPSFSSPLLSVFLDLSLHLPLLPHHTAMESKGQESVAMGNVLVEDSNPKRRASVRVSAGKRETEEDTVVENVGKRKTTSMLHSPSHALPSTISSPSSLKKGGAPEKMPSGVSGTVRSSEKMTASPRRGRGRPPGAKNKKLSLKHKRMMQPREQITAEDSKVVASSSSSSSAAPPPSEKKRRGRKPLSAAPKAPAEDITTSVSPLPARKGSRHASYGTQKKNTVAPGPLGALNNPALPVVAKEGSGDASSLVTASVDDIMRVMQQFSSSSLEKDSGAMVSKRKTSAKVPSSPEKEEEKLPWFHAIHDDPSSASPTSDQKPKKSGALRKSSISKQTEEEGETTERVSFSPHTTSPVLSTAKTPKGKKKEQKTAPPEKASATALSSPVTTTSATPITAPHFSDSIAKLAVQDFLSRIKRPEASHTSTSSSDATRLSSTVKPVLVTPPILKIPSMVPKTKAAEKKKKGTTEKEKGRHEMKPSTAEGEKVFHF